VQGHPHAGSVAWLNLKIVMSSESS